MNEGKLIAIDFTYEANTATARKINLSFRDSYLILPASLSKLAKSFNTDTGKGIFPYNFVNKTSNLNYVGKIPAFKYFDCSKADYDSYVNGRQSLNKEVWSLKEEAKLYCYKDCKALYEVLLKFSKLYFDLFKININKQPTLSSHAFRVFRTHFMNKDEIPMIFGRDSDIIRDSYTGGATDMYIPTNSDKELVYAYDVNSLYPSVMLNKPMPTGNMTYFQGNILAINPNAFGFFYCDVEAPLDLKHPVIQLHIKTKSGMRTIAPVGKFKTMLFSEEIHNAVKFGYKFNVLKGYTFDQKVIFKDYVKDLYNLRLTYPKTDPMNYISKLFLNSLYGRFGMKYNFDLIKILTRSELESIFTDLINVNLSISDISKIGEKFIVHFEKEFDEDAAYKKEFNVNIAIASAITAYARIYMSQFKNNPDLKLFYTDTDSIYTSAAPEDMNKMYPGIVNAKELGKLKLESVSKKAIFLAPKCYALELLDGELVYKVKGLMKSVPIDISDFEKLLTKDSLILKEQSKWYKSLSRGSIMVLKQTYTLLAKLKQTTKDNCYM